MVTGNTPNLGHSNIFLLFHFGFSWTFYMIDQDWFIRLPWILNWTWVIRCLVTENIFIRWGFPKLWVPSINQSHLCCFPTHNMCYIKWINKKKFIACEAAYPRSCVVHCSAPHMCWQVRTYWMWGCLNGILGNADRAESGMGGIDLTGQCILNG